MDGLEYVDKVIGIDQQPIGRTPRSNPATYTGVFNDIRYVCPDPPALMGLPLAHALGIPMEERALRRTRQGTAQAGLSREERLIHTAGLFRANGRARAAGSCCWTTSSPRAPPRRPALAL